MLRFSRVVFAGVLALIIGAPLTGKTALQPGLKSLDFSTDPGWEGVSNEMLPSPLPSVRQDFGPSDTRHAGGKSAGELGGRIERSVTRASYAKKIKPKTLNDRLSASGKFAVTADEGGTGALFGWFNDAESRGWRTNNSLVLRLDGNKERYFVFAEYGTHSWLAHGKGAFEGERWQTTRSKPMLPDGTTHTWSIDCDPSGADDNGLITLVLDGEIYQLPLEPGHKADGATFDRFGLFNQMISGGAMEGYFDDIVLDGQPLDSFEESQGWEGKGNRGEFPERIVSEQHDFGYRADSAFAGGKSGEIGGVIWRGVKHSAHYADRVGPLSLEDELFAEGTISFRGAGSDSGVYIGWFDSESRSAKTSEESDDPARSILGIFLEGPSRVGHYFRPVYRTAAGSGDPAETGPIIRPDGQVHRWSVRYLPEAGGGKGQIVVTFDGKDQTLNLADRHRREGASFNRFGIFCQQQGGHSVEVYLDDITYTARRK